MLIRSNRAHYARIENHSVRSDINRFHRHGCHQGKWALAIQQIYVRATKSGIGIILISAILGC